MLSEKVPIPPAVAARLEAVLMKKEAQSG